MLKRFLEWIRLKEKIHKMRSDAPLVSEREIWWIMFGENIGSEINGKNDRFSRPGLILKKLSHTFYLVVPSTTQKREGSWYVPISYGCKDMYMCLHQIRAVDYRRLSGYVCQINSDDFGRIKKQFFKLYK
jgi:mRNA interferase MazF